MFLDAIALETTLPCLAEPGKIIVIGKPNHLLTDVIPYLASLPNVIAYHPEACALTIRRQHGFITLNADKVYITQVKDVGEGLELLKALADAINATWEHRAELVAATVMRSAPRLLDIWALLPQTNCKQCGEATCMAFAAALLQRMKLLAECPVLGSDPASDERQAALNSML
jgi:ArsR family metal-binding transcriptional regulator